MIKHRKIKVYGIVFISMLILYLLICISFYQNNLNKFKEYINTENYLEAKNISSDKSLNIISIVNFKNTCDEILNEHLSKLNNDYLTNNLSQESLLLKLNSLQELNLNNKEVSVFKESLPLVSQSNEIYLKAIELFNQNNYEKALEYFNEVSVFNSNYKEILNYKNQCIDILK